MSIKVIFLDHTWGMPDQMVICYEGREPRVKGYSSPIKFNPDWTEEGLFWASQEAKRGLEEAVDNHTAALSAELTEAAC